MKDVKFETSDFDIKIFKNKDFHPRTKRAFLIQSIECIGKALCVLENRYNF